ncbi:MAG: hypothetical protein VB124_01280, partial [Burkholderia sp.]
LLEAKNREFSQEPELLTGVLDWLLGINVNRSLARPIYATTPSRCTRSGSRRRAGPLPRGAGPVCAGAGPAAGRAPRA